MSGNINISIIKLFKCKNYNRYIISVLLLYILHSNIVLAAVKYDMTDDIHKTCVSDSTVAAYRKVPVILKSNLLYDAILMPSLEIQYLLTSHWYLALETSIAWWHNDNKHRYFQNAMLIPELGYRIHAGKNRHFHSVGIFGGMAWYDLENKGIGYQGEAWFAGVCYNYSFPVNKYLGFEAGLGLGILNTKYEEYMPVDGHYVYQQSSRSAFIGPLRLKFAILFDFNNIFNSRGYK